MIKNLHLKNIGPSPTLTMDFAPRLNLIAGDNGIGKSFLLDVVWWSLTRTWAGMPALPAPQHRRDASIAFTLGEGKPYQSSYDVESQQWTGKSGRPYNPGFVIYAKANGDFCVWDSARNYWREKDGKDVQERTPAYFFNQQQVWSGATTQDGTVLCEGLLRDWATWQKAKESYEFDYLKDFLHALSPSSTQPITPGGLTRINLDDARDIPTINMPYQESVPLVYAAEGIRRICALAYVVTWAVMNHLEASSFLDKPAATNYVVLVDEIELHLHPKWQRTITRSIVDWMINETLILHSVNRDFKKRSKKANAQFLITTHAPLVLASVEPFFDEEQDAIWHLEEVPTPKGKSRVELSRLPWYKRGDVINWLSSETFGLAQGRSLEAEEAIEAAEAWMRGETKNLPKGLQTKAEIHQRLLALLPEHDHFWPRWVVTPRTDAKTKAAPNAPEKQPKAKTKSKASPQPTKGNKA